MNIMPSNIDNKKSFSQFYTSYDLGLKMVSLISPKKNINDVIDLSIGEGVLVDSVLKKHPNINVFGVDIDFENIKKINEKYGDRIYSFHGDSTTKFVLDKLNAVKNKFDLVIGNPPYSLIDTPDNIWNSFPDFFIPKKKFRAENLFLLNGLSLLKKNGILAYILPDGFFTNQNSSTLREFISNKYNILEIMEVSGGHFLGTEAKTHIIIIQNSSSTSNNIKLTHMGNKSEIIYINKKDFIYRGDYSFYHKPKFSSSNSTIGEQDIKIIRGRIFNDKNSIKEKDQFLHTTAFSHQYNEFYNSINIIEDNIKIARKNDIVIPRVGSRCIGKIGLIIGGYFYISDCLIIIRCNNYKLRKQLIINLLSKNGQDWLKSIARGVGAKHLTIDDIKQFPILQERRK